MSVVHPLLKNASTYARPAERDLSPEGCVYDFAIGAWVVCSTGELFIETAGGQKPRTKKQDVETGEDQKGE